ncbi:serine/threonine-protein phosphatase rdgC isoform X2 [Bactrocera dorsalis]|uniref:Serine/threonine-protein phosphatase n=1 Tax=Bactrocera dorsalis TaxID=27457 RepID=A0A8N4KZS1_BACDO|nr:serine/threonine-protein phosphatase rdgC isoform X2 [Bactrocera dorsalis]
MLRSCVCLGRGAKRRSSSLEDTSSCRSSEIERVAKRMETMTVYTKTTTTSKTTTTTTSKLQQQQQQQQQLLQQSNDGGRSTTSSLLQFFQSKTWYRHWRKTERSMSMSKTERTLRAALLIQRWYRRYRARMEVRRRYTWTIFTNLEYAGENDQVELYNFFNALLTHIPEAAAAQRPSLQRDSEVSLDFNEDGEYRSDKNYDGPHLKFPLIKKDVVTLIDVFRKKKSDRLLAKYVGGILKEAAFKLKRLPNLNQASTAISKQVTVIGDLHGKLDDLLVIFYKNGLPSVENPYVFNGDFVDRGKKGLEVFLLLLVCFLAFPGAVHLNRGNHEDSVMNARYGFIREVQQKYRRNADKLMIMIEEVYRWLPLGTIVNNRVLIVHGGISDTTDLDMIKSIDRGKYVSILRPPIEMAGEDGIDKVEWKQIFDIMWSDPQITDGCKPNALRGAGTYFGPDVTKQFLEKYKLKFLVRSHECKPDGHEFTHNKQVITIFSASNYYAVGSNKGAYLKFGPQLDTQFVQYISAASKTARLSFQQRISIVEASALRELGARLRDRRVQLEEEFSKLDPKNTGGVTVAQWSDIMERVTQMSLPWRLMRDRLAPPFSPDEPNIVNYLLTLELLETDVIVEEAEASTSVTDALYKNKSSLEAIFHILDKDHSGQISLDEFGDAVDLLRKYMPSAGSKKELMNMCQMMDINKDGFVDLNEFLEAFRLCDQARKAPQPTKPKMARRKSLSDSLRVAELAEQLSVQKFADTETDIDPRDHVSVILSEKPKI